MDELSSSDLSAVPLGPFDLYERIGTGGMGVVYRARHRATSTQVAVKVVRGEPDDRARRRFRREVQSHAALIHPAIVQLLEYGMVDPQAVEASAGALKAGSPYVAMELADGGTIHALEMSGWSDVRNVLEQVLGALGHAHARGVIHRDLKPDNLLVFRGDTGPDVRLTDFGIAHALTSIGERGKESLRKIIGTPRYMAPEQLLGRWREHGPWTDLYALGCIAYFLVTGAAPYQDLEGGGVQQAVAHLSQPPEALDPRFPIPEGLGEWIRTAMAVAPAARFQRASEALEALPEADAATSVIVRDVGPPSAHTKRFPNASEVTADTVALPTRPVDDGPLSSEGGPAAIHPPPSDWRPYAEPTTPLAGAGLGLIGLRQPAYVGREAERDAIWAAYRRSANDERLEAVLLEGEAGIGKTRLAQWAATLAHEVGSAQVLRLDDFARNPHGLEETLRTWMMSRDQVYGHLRQTLPALEGDRSRDYDARAVTALLRPTSSNRDEGGPGFVFSSPREKLVVVARLIERLAAVRPLLVMIDDLHDAPTSLDLLEHLFERPPVGRVFVVATLRSDIMASRPELTARIDELGEREAVTRLSVGPLSDEEQRQLVRQLTASDRAIDLLVDRMEGNPLFGVQLLTDWAERGLVGEAGEPDATAAALDELPADIHAVWLGRIRRLETHLEDPVHFRQSLELAAVMGKEVSRDDWEALRQVSDPAPDFWERLVARGLARRTDTGWRFAHGLLVKTLHRLAREAGRWQEHHRRCAEALEPTFRRQPLLVARRLADHWIAAGLPERALGPLLEEGERLQREDIAAACHETLMLRADLMDELGVPPDDLQRLGNDLGVARAEFRLGGAPTSVYENVIATLERMEGRTAPELESRGWQLAAACKLAQAEMTEARECASRGVAAAEASGNKRELAMAKLKFARIDLQSARAIHAGEIADEVCALAVETEDRYLFLRGALLGGWAAWNAGDYDSAERVFRDALDGARELGSRAVEADCLNGLGELGRARGNVNEAVDHYRGAELLYLEMQQPDDAAIVSMNLASTYILAGDFAAASDRLDSAARQLDAYGYDFVRNHIHLARLAVAAGEERWEAFDRLLSGVDEILDDASQLTPDDLRQARVSLDLVRKAGESKRAAALDDFARRMAEELEAEAAPP